MANRKKAVKLRAKPKLRRPYLVAGWSGMGAVALLAVNFLRQELGANLLAEIDPHAFFSPSQVHIKERLIQTPEFPETKFYYWKSETAHDLIIFVGTAQPPQGYKMARLILETVERFGVERIYTAAAFPSLIHHSQVPGMWGSTTHLDLLTELEAHSVKIMDQGTISGLNGLLLAAAKERDLKGLCLLGEIPIYTTQMINPKASRAVLTTLTQMLDIEVNLTKLTLWAEDLTPQMDNLYRILPAQVKEAIESDTERNIPPTIPALKARPDLVADEAFFDEIERFLQQHWQEKSEDENESHLS